MLCRTIFNMLCVLCTQKTLCSSITIISEYISMFQKGDIVLKIFFVFWKCSVPEKLQSVSGALSQLWETTLFSEDCGSLQFRFVRWDFSSLEMCTRIMGRSFWGIYVYSGANLILLIMDTIFNTKYHLQSLQDFISKVYMKALPLR